jgi:glycerophosphoryl diester phosphodiesterase
MIVIGHRGAPYEALENSWTAFEKAIEGGAQRIELDVHLTRDHQLVVMHDETLKRTAGHHDALQDLDRHDLEQMQLLNGEAIPFLDQVIDRLLERVELNIEIKGNDDSTAREVAKLLHAHPLRDKIIVSSFYQPPLEFLAWKYPSIQLACLWGDGELHWPFFGSFAPPVFMQACQAKIFHPWIGFLSDSIVDAAKNRGWKVFPYAGYLNGDERQGRELIWSRLYSWGVDGLCTNYPRELANWLKELNIYDNQTLGYNQLAT